MVRYFFSFSPARGEAGGQVEYDPAMCSCGIEDSAALWVVLGWAALAGEGWWPCPSTQHGCTHLECCVLFCTPQQAHWGVESPCTCWYWNADWNRSYVTCCRWHYFEQRDYATSRGPSFSHSVSLLLWLQAKWLKVRFALICKGWRKWLFPFHLELVDPWLSIFQ